MKAFVSWSGGKDCALACFSAARGNGLEITHIVNMLGEDGALSRSHHLPARLLALQGRSMGVSTLQKATSWEEYEVNFKEILVGLRQNGVEAGVFGDIDLEPHREWVERVCRETGIVPFLPLWLRGREELMDEFIGAGFRAVIVATDAASPLTAEWLGRRIDQSFREDMARVPGVDLCGEKGEYHTFVFDGPIFKSPVAFSAGKKLFKDNHWFLTIESEEK